MKNVYGILNLHDGPSLGQLTEDHPLGSISFLGRYGIMDFALSNLTNSGIDRIAILVGAYKFEGTNGVKNLFSRKIKKLFNS